MSIVAWGRLIGLATCAAGLFGAAGAGAEPDADRTLYGSVCSACHGSTLTGDSRGPALKGQAFMAGWTSRTGYDLYTLIILAMPADNPGVISEDDALRLVLLILRENGLSAKTSNVRSPEDLKAIVIG